MPFNHHACLRCPLDDLPLMLEDGSLRCAGKHAFDIARQGYVNLLGAQDKRSRDPGDDKAMVSARHQFLQDGHYQPIADSIGQLLVPAIVDNSVIVDAGCGEGYYLQQLRATMLNAERLNPSFIGFDISKWAMQVAARRFPATWMVASNRKIPLADESADVVLDMFGFPDFEEFARVLKPRGLMVQVRSGDNHLRELREVIYPQLISKPRPQLVPAQFEVVRTQTVSHRIAGLDAAGLSALLLMTPHFFRASAEGRARASALQSLDVSVDVTLSVFART